MDRRDHAVLNSSIRRWTPAERSILRRLAHTHSVDEIAAALRRTPVAVRSKAAHERIALLRGRETGADVRF